MKVSFYSVRDVEAQEYGPVFQAKNDAVANRNFLTILKGTAVPSAFRLHRLGVFDTETGEMWPKNEEVVVVDMTVDQEV